MCGRFVGFRGLEELIEHFAIEVSNVEVVSNYNVAPTQKILAIVRHDEQNHLEKYHWGLVQSLDNQSCPYCSAKLNATYQ